MSNQKRIYTGEEDGQALATWLNESHNPGGKRVEFLLTVSKLCRTMRVPAGASLPRDLKILVTHGDCTTRAASSQMLVNLGFACTSR